MRVLTLALAACLALIPQSGRAQDAEYAQQLFDRQQYAAALELADGLCEAGDKLGCDVVKKLTTTRGLPTYDPAAFVRIFSIACKQPDGGPFCGDAALAASGSWIGLPDYKNWSQVAEPGRTGCTLLDARSCYAMSVLYASSESPSRDLWKSVFFSREACKRGIAKGCSFLMVALRDKSLPTWTDYANDYLLAYERACQLGERSACSEVPRGQTMKSRVARFGVPGAKHLLAIDLLRERGDWAGAMQYALEKSRHPEVIEYTFVGIERAGHRSKIRWEDLQAVSRIRGNSYAGQFARAEMDQRRNPNRATSYIPPSRSRPTTTSTASSTPSRPASTPTRTCTETYTGGGIKINGRGHRIVRCN